MRIRVLSPGSGAARPGGLGTSDVEEPRGITTTTGECEILHHPERQGVRRRRSWICRLLHIPNHQRERKHTQGVASNNQPAPVCCESRWACSFKRFYINIIRYGDPTGRIRGFLVPIYQPAEGPSGLGCSPSQLGSDRSDYSKFPKTTDERRKTGMSCSAYFRSRGVFTRSHILGA